MAKRTAFIVMLGALALLGANFSLQAEAALAHGSNEASLAQIALIGHAASVQVGVAENQVANWLESATSNGEAKDIRDGGLESIEDIYWGALVDIYWVAEAAHFDEEVTSAGWVAQASLEADAIAAAAAVDALYDSWYAEWSAPSAEEVIGGMEEKLRRGLNKIDEIVADLTEEFEDGRVDSLEEATEKREQALEDLAEQVQMTGSRLDEQLARRPSDPAVQAAHASAHSQLAASASAATSTINAVHSAWVGENTAPPTTTTLPPTTTTTIPKPKATTTTTTTTTTTAPPPPVTTTTTTTLPAPAALPPTEPPTFSQTAFMSDTPARVVQVSAASATGAFEGDSEMSTVGFVKRIVDSQLPAGVSTVAAGPLVVLGLVVDAIRAAGALMAVPWIVLIVYMLGLLRERRLSVESAG